MRVLITGGSGFAGRHLVSACAAAGDEVISISRSGAAVEGATASLAVDVGDVEALRRVLRQFEPAAVYHLAARSSVAESWEQPAVTVEENVVASLSVLEALRHECGQARVVWASSCQVYGEAEGEAITEEAPLRPSNPYAVSKSTGDLLAGLYSTSYGLDIVRARPFNHSGPGQKPSFILSSIAQQAARAKLDGAEEIRITTGNPDTRRDFTDVRDVVAAYRLLAARAPAGVYNVSSGVSVSPAELLALLAEPLAPARVEHVVDQALVRSVEVMDLRGDPSRLRQATGWEPRIPLRQTLLDTIEWWERELSSQRPRV